jgi:hypothetical protein
MFKKIMNAWKERKQREAEEAKQRNNEWREYNKRCEEDPTLPRYVPTGGMLFGFRRETMEEVEARLRHFEVIQAFKARQEATKGVIEACDAITKKDA